MRRSPLAVLLLLAAYLAGALGAPWLHEGRLVPSFHPEESGHDEALLPAPSGGGFVLHEGENCAACVGGVFGKGGLPPSAPCLGNARVIGPRPAAAASWIAGEAPRPASARSPPAR